MLVTGSESTENYGVRPCQPAALLCARARAAARFCGSAGGSAGGQWPAEGRKLQRSSYQAACSR